MELKVSFGFDGSGEVVGNAEMTGTDFEAERELRVRRSDDGFSLGHVHTFISLKHYFLQ